MINSICVADSLSPQGERLVSILATFPRIILAEVNTHRMLSKNTSSSRAIPFFKMVQSLYTMPFIPIAWQRHHPGMQGSDYVSVDTIITIPSYVDDFIELIRKQAVVDKFKIDAEFEQVLTTLKDCFIRTFASNEEFTIKDLWLKTRDIVVACATMLYTMGGVTKQICNRLLEPFMWTTMLITGNVNDEAWGNFFKLRCPQYVLPRAASVDIRFKSWKDVIKHDGEITSSNPNHVDRIAGAKWLNDFSILDRLKQNKGLAEIHMMALAESIYDTINDSIPKQLQAGEWHIPFGDNIKDIEVNSLLKGIFDIRKDGFWGDKEIIEHKVKVSTAMGARTSYTVVGQDKDSSYESLIGLDDRLLNQEPPHSSPMEHCSKAMSDKEYSQSGKFAAIDYTDKNFEQSRLISLGWCRNFRGFIQRRHLIETNTN